ncbi:heterocyst frequency control protein PatD [Leptolyngbya sp. FACHB-36]|uniref:heterocyst frequency control protein PatD n=1 Tax=Leptolyngbya sp. FACHB-36 TaxID=2692808 RepID=UPI0016812F10|nr:heterocyst frequency control protein PatD [Leptolyngbya sp. FACHB-36]MBD2022399.1 heterocyst frequency control protein PatD [Leptolyngbya sp. FACHB-36]
MLTNVHQQAYQVFKHKVEILGGALDQDDRATLSTAIAELQPWFQTQLLTLSIDDLDPVQQQQVQSYQVEMNKQLRLLAMDSLFLQAARQSATAGQRQEQIRDRVSTLIRYCDALLGTDDSSKLP